MTGLFINLIFTCNYNFSHSTYIWVSSRKSCIDFLAESIMLDYSDFFFSDPTESAVKSPDIDGLDWSEFKSLVYISDISLFGLCSSLFIFPSLFISIATFYCGLVSPSSFVSSLIIGATTIFSLSSLSHWLVLWAHLLQISYFSVYIFWLSINYSIVGRTVVKRFEWFFFLISWAYVWSIIMGSFLLYDLVSLLSTYKRWSPYSLMLYLYSGESNALEISMSYSGRKYSVKARVRASIIV